MNIHSLAVSLLYLVRTLRYLESCVQGYFNIGWSSRFRAQFKDDEYFVLKWLKLLPKTLETS